MGFGVSLALMAIGAVLAFATRFSISGLDVQLVGWILILVGVASLLFTLLYVRPRRRAQMTEVVGQEPMYRATDEVEPDVVVRHEHDPYSANAPTRPLGRRRP